MDEQLRNYVSYENSLALGRARQTIHGVATKRFFVSDLENRIKNSGLKVFILSGLRGTGKTTALYHLLLADPDNTAYFSCDDLLAKNISLDYILAALDFVKKENVGMEKKFTLLLDEVTYLENWGLLLKILNDKRLNLIIVATSSSVLPLRKSLELARRSTELLVFPFSFKEYLLLKHKITIPEEVSRSIREKIGKDALYKEYSSVILTLKNKHLFGLFEEFMLQDLPFSLSLDGSSYFEAANVLLKRTIYEDFLRFENFETKLLQASEKLITYISAVPCDGVKLTTLSEVSQISKESVGKLLLAFENAMIIKGIEHEGRNRMYKKPKKWFFYSSSMRYALAAPIAKEAEIVGNLREDAAFMHLIRLYKSVFYSHEADFIAGGLKFEIEKNKKQRSETIILGMDERIDVNRIPLPLFALSV